jgi:ParB-like chromosome segregation protein Spo0J
MNYLYGKPATKALLASVEQNPAVVHGVPLENVSVEEGFNVRNFDAPENKDHVKRLATLIGAHGIETPLRARIVEGRIVLTDGECRVRAAYLARENGAPQRDVPVLLDIPLDGGSDADYIASLVIKNTGKPLAMLETLEVVKRMQDAGVSATDIGTRLGFSRMHLSNLRVLDTATDATKMLIAKGRIAPSTVVELLKENKDHEDPAAFVEAAVTTAVKKIEQQEARAVEPARITPRAVTPAGDVVYTKPVFNGLISTLQRLLADMKPASDYRKWRNWARQALENAGAPLEADEPVVETE